MTLRIGFIGTGGIAGYHIRNVAQLKDVQLAAFYDLDVSRAQKAASEHSGATAYSDVDAMLDGAGLDGVYVCVPPMAHGNAERKLIERGIPFFVEKPIGLNRDIPDEIGARVKEKKLITSVGYHWRYTEATAIAKRLLAESKPGMALGYWMGGMPMVPWWRQQSGSGGQFVEQTTHIVDLLRYTCGEVREVYAAYALKVMGEQVEGTDVPDVGTVTMKLANGMVATVSNTCLLPLGHHVGLDIYTNNGVLELRDKKLNELTPEGTKTHTDTAEPFFLEDEAFVYAVRTGDASRIKCDYEEALRTHDVTMAANESAASGAPVRLNA